MSKRVRRVVYLVPDGIGEDGRCKATLIVTPCEANADEGCYLDKWPSETASWLHDSIRDGKVKIRWAPLNPEGRAFTPVEDVRHSIPSSTEGWASIDAIWPQCFRALGANWESTLCKAVTASSNLTAGSAIALSDAYAMDGVNSQSLDIDGSIVVDLEQEGKKKTLVGVVPVRHGALAIDEERERALRVLRIADSGPHSMDDERKLSDDLRDPKDVIPPRDGKEFQEAVRDASFAQLDSDIKNTNSERELSKKAFKTALAWLDNHECKETQSPCVMSADYAPIPLTADRDPSARRQGRASHAYATMPQRRRSDVQQPKNDRTGYEAAATSDIGVGDTDEANALFYHLQSDPKLARLFCLAIDITFAPPDSAPAQVAIDVIEVGTDAETPIATAATLTDASFWPLSAFAAHHDGKACDSLVEQADGVCDLGMSDAASGVCRFDLLHLDVRSALESKQHAIDRGERHRSSGFSIIDRGRGLQIARELALKQHHQGPATPKSVTLYAENLTVGRRMDVACVTSCEKIDNATPWKSLYRRWVDFSFDKSISPTDAQHAQTMLRDLVEPEHKGRLCFKDEGVFQLSARQMPKMGAAGEFEAVADEAILLWDGMTPVDQHDPRESCQDLSMPIFAHRHLRVPEDNPWLPSPLRYGRAYIFGMRSVFRGGGSPDVKQAAAYHAVEGGKKILPRAKEDGTLRPRRFLRHDALPAPLLLMPKDRAFDKIGALGTEPLDQAIVRSTFARVASTPQPSPLEHASPYITLEYRKGPFETARVFVAPESPVNEVRRHGCLDGTDKESVALGGLKGVGFIRPKSAPDETIARAHGFPAAVTQRIPSLLGEDVYERRFAGVGSEGGISLFDVGGTHEVTEYGWLPDPAAARFSIRARIRGSDRYLPGELSAQLYDAREGIGYPHALPLVVRLRRAAKERDLPAVEIANLTPAHANQVPLGRLAGQNGSSVRVRELVLELYEGEDYDLEVACLPNADCFAALFALPETIAMQAAYAADNEAANAVFSKYRGALDLMHLTASDEPAWCGLGNCPVPDKASIKSVSQLLLNVIANRWPIEEIAAVTRLRVCHATNRPNEVAAKSALLDIRASRPADVDKPDGNCTDTIGVTAFHLSGKIQLDLEKVDAFELFADTTSVSGKPLDDPSRSRSVLSRRSGRWPQYAPNSAADARKYVEPCHVLGFSVAADGRVKLPTQRVRLLRVENLPLPDTMGDLVESCTNKQEIAKCKKSQDIVEPYGKPTGRLTPVDLGFLHTAARTGKRIEFAVKLPDGAIDVGEQEDSSTPARLWIIKSTQPHVFADTKARRLTLGIRLLSRFAELFETTPRYVGGTESLLQRRQPLDESEQSVLGNTATLCIPSSQRPASCEPHQPEPAFLCHRSEDVLCGEIQRTFARRALTRIYLRRGWFSSGDGERLGIVLWPPHYFGRGQRLDEDKVSINGRDMDIVEFDDADLGPGGAFISRWGGDPIRADGHPQQRVLINTGAFGDLDPMLLPDCWRSPHDPKVVDYALMPVLQGGAASKPDVGNSSETNMTFLPVSLLTYEPCFDLDREEWYVDIDLRPLSPSEPIVRLGLVRYQSESVCDEIKVSQPVTVMAPLLPRRELVVSLSQATDRIAVRMSGSASHGIKDMQAAEIFKKDIPPEKVAQIISNVQRMQRPVLKLTLFHQTVDRDGKPLNRVPIYVADEEELEISGTPLPDGDVLWETMIPVPKEALRRLGKGTLVLHAEEADRRLPATFPEEPIAAEDQFCFSDAKASFGSPIYSGPRFSASIDVLEYQEERIAPCTPTQSSESSSIPLEPAI